VTDENRDQPSRVGSAGGGPGFTGHVFISYARDDAARVDQLQQALEAAGIPVWRDTVSLWPGEDWRAKIRDAITRDALVFLACFSNASLARARSYQNEEILLAIEELRRRRPGVPWLIPIRFDDCEIPDLDIGGGRTLTSIHQADVFAERFDQGAARVASAVLRVLGPVAGSVPGSAEGQAAPVAESFGVLLRRLRQESGFALDDFAKTANVRIRTLNDLERGVTRTPREATVALLANALGLTGTERAAFEAAARGGSTGGEPPLDEWIEEAAAKTAVARNFTHQLRTATLSVTRLRPGYDEEEVDKFLDGVTDELDGLTEEFLVLRAALAHILDVGWQAADTVPPKRIPSVTPADIRNKQFGTTRLRPGYEEEEVDALLGKAEEQVSLLIDVNENLRDRLTTTLRQASETGSPAGQVAQRADEWAAAARELVSAGAYQEAGALLADAPAANPAAVAQVRLELGFVALPDTDRRIIAEVWKATVAGKYAVPEPAASPVPSVMAKPTRERRSRQSAQQSGAVLEQATADLFTRLFTIDPSRGSLLLGSLRRQGAGTQFGHDIELECGVAGNPSVRCHVECKNLNRPVTLTDIAAKLAQQKFHHRDAVVDHWILISPHHDATNELRLMLTTWENAGEFPFSVQVWSPENRIRELFALEPAVYQAIYGQWPSDDELTVPAQQAVEIFTRRLAPRLRIDPVWRRYLQDPRSLCFVNEDSRHSDALYGNHLALQAADERGALLDGTLMDQVTAWARDGTTSPLLLLADFGEGKSVFTYCLARRLCEEFLASPDGRVFPLRIPLREFTDAGDARGLLQRRLSEAGASISDWRRLTGDTRTLAILDGFDEMSADLSPEIVTANLRGVEACLAELTGSKILVTSRQRILDGTRDWQRTQDRLQHPRIVRIASGSRRQRVQYLEQFATDETSARVLANLRGLYDPIGLAAKPLFLQMIKETLTELPDDAFSERILYETYIARSLRRKIEFLADADLTLTHDELVTNLQELLEDIAVQLQEENLPFINLRDYQVASGGRMAELLWRMRDQAVPREPFGASADDDATSRVGIRSLLKAVPGPDGDRWPVDFFHRSMREYFVARAIVRRLSADPDRARRILRAAPLLPEITHFVATILRENPNPDALAALESFARGATISLDTGYLGGNAITLLYATRGGLPAVDWSGLRLDHAQLRGANLAGARFAGASLRYANLDNANLDNADLTGADLEGVQLDETTQVLAVAALGGDKIIAAYEDRSLRQWRPHPGAAWESRVIAILDHQADRLQLTPRGRLVASGDGVLSVLDVHAGQVPQCQFRTNSRFRATVLGVKSTLLVEEIHSGVTRLAWLDTTSGRVLDTMETDAAITSCAQVDGKLYAFATFDAVHVIFPGTEVQRGELVLADHGISCVDLRADQDCVLVAVGRQDGTVSVTRVGAGGRDADPAILWRRALHEAPVTAIQLSADDQVITGSKDRAVCVIPFGSARPESAKVSPHRLRLTLRCANVRIAGVRTDREQAKLRRYAAG
jgi:DivIVA domain-containing protein